MKYLASIFCLLTLSIFSLPIEGANKVLVGDGEISLYNLHLGESISVKYRDENGKYSKGAISLIQMTLRCRLTDEIHKLPVELIELVDQIQDHFKAEKVNVVSAYRSKLLNSHLFEVGRKVAKNSLHTYGMAMDIQVPGISTQLVRDYAYFLDKGGVGFYGKDGFVHVDVGPKRHW